MISLRLFEPRDWRDVWTLLEPVFRGGEVYAYPPDIAEAEVRKLWVDRPVATWVASRRRRSGIPRSVTSTLS